MEMLSSSTGILQREQGQPGLPTATAFYQQYERAQATIPTLGSFGFGQAGFGGQCGGTRVAAHTPTELYGDTITQPGLMMESISAMQVYKDKIHEELRWEDYQLGDKGGPAPAGQSTGAIVFGATTTQSNPFVCSSPFGRPAPTGHQSTGAIGFGATTTQSNPFVFSPAFEIKQQSIEPGLDNSNIGAHTASAKKDDFWKYIPLYQAALRGDWATAETIFTVDEGALTAKINEYEETALHVAAGAGRSSKSINFVKKLVDKLPEALELSDQFKCTPLHLAAWAGNKEAAKVLLKKQPSLLYIRECTKLSALDLAARNAKKDTLLYLLEFTKDDPFSELFPDDHSAAHFLILVITSGFYDIALELVEKYASIASTKEFNGDCGLKALARKVSAFKSGSDHQWWQRIIYAQLAMKEETTSHTRGDIENAVVDDPQIPHQKYNRAQHMVEYFCSFVPCIKNIQDQKKTHVQALKLLKRLCEGIRSLNDSDAYNLHAKDALLTAAKLGIHEVMEEIVESFPNLLWAKNVEKLNLFQIAVKERHANVFNLIYQMGDYQEVLVQIKDDFGNNLLHLAGRLGPKKNNLVSGAAMQMQRELQWFEEVKKFANPRDIDWRNKYDETPAMLFTKDHEKLGAEGEKWMKNTANSCTIPAALIVTVVFAAAIAVPGGINGDGLPIFSKELVFNIFAVFNAISLFASITSLLVSLSILTSRYAEGDFLFALPNRLIIGLVTLFLSITTMVVAFGSALYLMFGNKDKAWILCAVVVLAFIPIFSFASLQFPLLLDLMVSTYRPRIFGKQSDRLFY